MIPAAQADQCALDCLASLFALGVWRDTKDPEFMKRFEAWKAERDKRKEEPA